MEPYGGRAGSTIQAWKVDQSRYTPVGWLVVAKKPTILHIQGVRGRFSHFLGRSGDFIAIAIDRSKNFRYKQVTLLINTESPESSDYRRYESTYHLKLVQSSSRVSKWPISINIAEGYQVVSRKA